jgi:hypothetical protein
VLQKRIGGRKGMHDWFLDFIKMFYLYLTKVNLLGYISHLKFNSIIHHMQLFTSITLVYFCLFAKMLV